MSFGVQYPGPYLLRELTVPAGWLAHGMAAAVRLGWDRQTPLTIRDADGMAIAGRHPAPKE